MATLGLIACSAAVSPDPTKDRYRLPSVPDPPTDEEIASAELGQQPSVTEMQSTVRIVLQRELKDYETARIEFVDPTFKAILTEHHLDPAEHEGTVIRSYYREDPFGPARIAWAKLVYVNAKNSYGGYTGYKTWVFYWVNGKYVFHDAPAD